MNCESKSEYGQALAALYRLRNEKKNEHSFIDLKGFTKKQAKVVTLDKPNMIKTIVA